MGSTEKQRTTRSLLPWKPEHRLFGARGGSSAHPALATPRLPPRATPAQEETARQACVPAKNRAAPHRINSSTQATKISLTERSLYLRLCCAREQAPVQGLLLTALKGGRFMSRLHGRLRASACMVKAHVSDGSTPVARAGAARATQNLEAAGARAIALPPRRVVTVQLSSRRVDSRAANCCFATWARSALERTAPISSRPFEWPVLRCSTTQMHSSNFSPGP